CRRSPSPARTTPRSCASTPGACGRWALPSPATGETGRTGATRGTLRSRARARSLCGNPAPRRESPSLLLRRRHDGDVQPVRPEVVVEQIDPPALAQLGEQLAHLVPPDGGQRVGVVAPHV